MSCAGRTQRVCLQLTPCSLHKTLNVSQLDPNAPKKLVHDKLLSLSGPPLLLAFCSLFCAAYGTQQRFPGIIYVTGSDTTLPQSLPAAHAATHRKSLLRRLFSLVIVAQESWLSGGVVLM